MIRVDEFCDKLRRRQISGSFAVALETGKLIKNLIGHLTKALDVQEVVGSIGQKLVAAQPIEFASGNMIKRIFHLIQEEEAVDKNEDGSLDGLEEESLGAVIRQGISEILDEIENSCSNIASQALEHIHSNEIILTLGHSIDVESFLKQAGRVRKFQVIVLETGPSFKGQEMACSLSEAGIDTTVINDSAVFAVMSRVNKVLLGAHAGNLVKLTKSNRKWWVNCHLWKFKCSNSCIISFNTASYMCGIIYNDTYIPLCDRITEYLFVSFSL